MDSPRVRWDDDHEAFFFRAAGGLWLDVIKRQQGERMSPEFPQTAAAIERFVTSNSPHHAQAPASRLRGIGIVFSLIVSFLIRLALVGLFLPFSALDKLLNPGAAVDQAEGSVHSRMLARALVGAALFVEVVMSAAVLSGFYDRLAAVILAGYCAVTALLWKQFWTADDFRLKGPSKGREVFWDFLKNFAVAGGFLILATGGTAYGIKHLIRHPLSSSHPYASAPLVRAPGSPFPNPTQESRDE